MTVLRNHVTIDIHVSPRFGAVPFSAGTGRIRPRFGTVLKWDPVKVLDRLQPWGLFNLLGYDPQYRPPIGEKWRAALGSIRSGVYKNIDPRLFL